jgi:hypothetical protein
MEFYHHKADKTSFLWLYKSLGYHSRIYARGEQGNLLLGCSPSVITIMEHISNRSFKLLLNVN